MIARRKDSRLFDSETDPSALITLDINSASNGTPNTNNTIISIAKPMGATTLLPQSTEFLSPPAPDSKQKDGEEEEEDVPMPTENGGFSHTKASKAKISQANKGKTPWNKGKAHSEEIKAKIRAGVLKRNRERFLKKLEEEGITEEEHIAREKAKKDAIEKEKLSRKTAKGGFTPKAETRKKISAILKAKYASGEIKRRRVDPSKVRRGFQHSEETRRKISESLRNRWATDPEYRRKQEEKSIRMNTSEDSRKRISMTLKKKWQDPEFRASMLEKMKDRRRSTERDAACRRKISAAMKKKWAQTEYRERVVSKIRARAERLRALRPLKPKVNKRTKKAIMNLRAKRRKRRLSLDANGKPIPTARPAKRRKKKKDEDDRIGSIDRLKEERRDLFDLLYGDEPEVGENDSSDSEHIDEDIDEEMFLDEIERTMASSGNYLGVEDEDLESFDPYGLE